MRSSVLSRGFEKAYAGLTGISFGLDGLGELLGAAITGLGALKNWVVDINSARLIEFCSRQFPKEFAELDDGDKLIMASFFDPGFLSNTRSLLNTAVLEQAELSEFDIFRPGASIPERARQLRQMLVEMFGRNAKFASPSQVFAKCEARAGAERWYFINGIATSLELALRNANRLSSLFGKEFITIYNPSQGFVLDLVESAMQKFTNVNTETVARAFVEIAHALSDPKVKSVRVVAHSQGTIVMGDVLDLVYSAIHDEFYRFTNMNSEDIKTFFDVSHGTLKSDELRAARDELRAAVVATNGASPCAGRGEVDLQKRRDLLAKLELYLFANAASNVCYMETLPKPLPLIESFANEHDAVARLGCLAKDRLHAGGLIRIDGPTFMAKGRYGHLLNVHYLRDFESAFGPKAPAYQALPRPVPETLQCVGESLNDDVQGNPCARNPQYVDGGQLPQSSHLYALYAATRAAGVARPIADPPSAGPPLIPGDSDSAARAPRVPSANLDAARDDKCERPAPPPP